MIGVFNMDKGVELTLVDMNIDMQEGDMSHGFINLIDLLYLQITELTISKQRMKQISERGCLF